MKKLFLLLNLMTLSLVAQTNPTTLKAQIDTQITNKTGVNSITKTSVGSNMKAIVDYATEQGGLKVDKITGKSLISDTEITRLSGVGLVKTIGNVDAVSDSIATLQYDINSISKDNGSEVKLPTTTETGKEVLVLARNYSGTIQVYANDAGEAKLSGGSNGISGSQGNLQINPREVYRFISLSNGYWYFEKIIDIPTNYYQLVSERSTDGTLASNSNFKYPTEQAVKTYVDSKDSRPYRVYTALISQLGTSAPTVIVLENTFGNIITWTRTDIGQYTGNLTGTFISDKTFCMTTKQIEGYNNTNIYMSRVANNEVRIITFANGSVSDDVVAKTNIEIRVYN